MALVFISHAHSDEVLARKVAALLGDALGLSPSDFFLSSQAGRGVAPAASIRASIVTEVQSASALVVLITPEAAVRPWVWLEAGNRLGCADKPTPIFIVPSVRFVPFLAPVDDLRILKLDNDGELHEFVKAVAQCVGRPALDFLVYKPALEDVAHYSARKYSRWAGRWASLRRQVAVGLLLLATALGIFWFGARGKTALRTELATAQSDLKAAKAELSEIQFDLNAGQLAYASRTYVLKGTVTSRRGGGPIHLATVMVSRAEVREPSACAQSDCAKTTTLTDGTFTLDLTSITAGQGDEVVLSVTSPGFRFYSTRLTVDVRATNAGNAPQNVQLTAQ